MKSKTQQQGNHQKQENSAISKYQAVEFTLSQDQYIMIQHFLPKGYTLQQRKSTKREKGSGYKNIDAEMSRYSGGFDNTDENQGRSKRARIKKIDRYLEQQMPRIVKRTNVEKLPPDAEMSFCSKILFQLKKHPNAQPFLEPVDSKKLGASHYFDIIKDPMDFQTIERNLKTGYYRKSSQFHGDINKIWKNSYLFNEKTSKIFKMTVQMQKFYRKILSQISTKKITETKSKLKQGGQRNKALDQQQEQVVSSPQLLKSQELKKSKNQQFSDKNKNKGNM